MNIHLKTCYCRRWDLIRIPCVHGVGAIVSSWRDPESFVHDCYSIQTHLKVYEFVINSIRMQSECLVTSRRPVAPNSELRLLGRPKKSRRNELNEEALLLRKQ